VLTGVTDPAQAVLAPPSQRPAYLAQDLSGLLESHPDVTHEGDTFSCGGWTATAGGHGDDLELSGDGKHIDGLRALCAAAWTMNNVTAESARPALKHLERAH
jgi:glycerol 3-phosphatase-2